MKRNIDIKEISDGKLYGPNDMVKADCRGCEGCSACCHGMGTSIVLTPLDIYRLEKELNASFGELMTKGVELNLADGVILPNLAMRGEKEACAFLMIPGDARSMWQDRISVVSFRLAESMRKKDFAIFCKSTSVKRKTGSR